METLKQEIISASRTENLDLRENLLNQQLEEMIKHDETLLQQKYWVQWVKEGEKTPNYSTILCFNIVKIIKQTLSMMAKETIFRSRRA